MECDINEFLNRKTIKIVKDVNSWKEAVKIGSRPLLDFNAIKKEYIKAMIDAVEKYGPYMVLDRYFALMHSRPEDGVKRTALSMLVSKEEIDMKGEKVKIFLILATKDNDEHIRVLSEITHKFSKEGIISKIIKSNTEKEIINILGGK